jgi:hypothetical protein
MKIKMCTTLSHLQKYYPISPSIAGEMPSQQALSSK